VSAGAQAGSGAAPADGDAAGRVADVPRAPEDPSGAARKGAPVVVPADRPPARRARTHDFNKVRKPPRKAPARPAPEPSRVEADGDSSREAAEETEPELVEEVAGGPSERAADLPVDAEAAPDASAGAIVPAAREALAPQDLLQRYMAEVTRHALLTREEETALARRYVDTGDQDAAFRLVTANLRLVVKIAWEYRRAAFNLLDLVQEGNVGLMQAVRKYDPQRGVKLSTYAAWWIRAYIIRSLMDNWRLVKLGTTQAQRKLFFNLRKEKEKLAARGFEPEPRLLAERLQVSEQDVVDMDRRLANDELSLDAPLQGDSAGGSYMDRLAQGGESADERLAEHQLSALFHEKLAVFAKGLVDKELFIFEKRLVAEEPLTLQEVGDRYGISRERARQIEARLLGRLKAWMKEHMPDYAQLTLEPRDD